MDAKNTTRLVMTASIETTLAERRLRELQEADEITDKELSTAIGRPMDSRTRSCVYTALRRLEKDGLHFGRIRTVGWKRLVPAQSLGKVEANTRRQHSLNRKNVRILTTLEYSRLSEAERRQYNAHLSREAVIAAITNAKALPKLEKALAPSSAPMRLAIAETLSALERKET